MFASSNNPFLFSAPVKLPFSVPKSIPSSKAAGIAAQFIGIKGLSFLKPL